MLHASGRLFRLKCRSWQCRHLGCLGVWAVPVSQSFPFSPAMGNSMGSCGADAGVVNSEPVHDRHFPMYVVKAQRSQQACFFGLDYKGTVFGDVFASSPPNSRSVEALTKSTQDHSKFPPSKPSSEYCSGKPLIPDPDFDPNLARHRACSVTRPLDSLWKIRVQGLRDPAATTTEYKQCSRPLETPRSPRIASVAVCFPRKSKTLDAA